MERKTKQPIFLGSLTSDLDSPTAEFFSKTRHEYIENI